MGERKKQRGQLRKLKNVCQSIGRFEPFTRTDEMYEHFHFPGDFFIEAEKTSGKIQTKFCKKWLETAEKFISQKPEDIAFCKVVALICVPNFWSSQIIIFYDEQYYNSFWDRKDSYQTWTPIGERRSFCKERNIETSLQETGYLERLEDEEVYESELWFYEEEI